MSEARTPGGVRYTFVDPPIGHYAQASGPPTDLHRLGRAIARLEEATERAETEARQYRAQYEHAYQEAIRLQDQLHGAEAKIDDLNARLEVRKP